MNKAIAFMVIIFFLPLFLIISILVYLKIDKKIFFIQKRVGLKNKEFDCYKFSSMVNNNKNPGDKPSHLEVHRVNKFGAFIRLVHIDELPQLVNILKGDMNFIGPRPHSTHDEIKFKKMLKFYHKRHSVRPGLTGFSQSIGYSGPIKNKRALIKRVSCDILYIKKKNFFFDSKIILNTILLIASNFVFKK